MDVKPFKAARPAAEIVSEVATLPYDVYSEAEAREIVDNNPKSFLSVVRPETLFPEGTDPADHKVYERARDVIEENIRNGSYTVDGEDSYYIYRQVMNGRAQTGVVACFSVDDYLENRIKKHELTRPAKEIDRMNHIDTCSAQTGLVFLTFSEGDGARAAIRKGAEGEPIYDFEAEDHVRQTVWKIDDPDEVAEITKAFAEIKSLYIADGHHRSASAAIVAKKRAAENKEHDGTEEYNYFMAVAFPCEELLVMPYYRVVSELNGLTNKEFLEKLEEGFIIETKDLRAYEPKAKGEVAMYLDNVWYKLTAREDIIRHDAVGNLDVQMLQDNILGPILGIEDPRTDNRIDFIGGIRGLSELEKRCHQDMRVAFATRHTTVEQLIRIADEGEIMPPKSTWFEPKLQSGLFIHKI